LLSIHWEVFSCWDDDGKREFDSKPLATRFVWSTSESIRDESDRIVDILVGWSLLVNGNGWRNSFGFPLICVSVNCDLICLDDGGEFGFVDPWKSAVSKTSCNFFAKSCRSASVVDCIRSISFFVWSSLFNNVWTRFSCSWRWLDKICSCLASKSSNLRRCNSFNSSSIWICFVCCSSSRCVNWKEDEN